MDSSKNSAVLFDFDGVIIDTEPQYSIFWHKVGVDYLGINDFGNRIKGQTLTYLYNTFFSDKPREQEEVSASLSRFEQEMEYDYIPGVLHFIADLKQHGVKMAVVTSSNEQKMSVVYRVHPELKTMFHHILTAEMFTASKPAPDCFLLGMELLGTTPQNTYVFEDSFNGLKAGMASGATVIGLSTTNPHQEIAPLCHSVIDDFVGYTYDKMLNAHK